MKSKKELKAQLKMINSQAEILYRKKQELEKELEEINLAPIRKKYEGRFFKYENSDQCYAYIKTIILYSESFMGFEGLAWIFDGENYCIETYSEGIDCCDLVEISKEEFQNAFAIVKNQMSNVIL